MTDQSKFRLNKISKIENQSLISEFNQIKLCSRKFSKYVTDFDYIDKIVLSATTGGVCIVSI